MVQLERINLLKRIIMKYTKLHSLKNFWEIYQLEILLILIMILLLPCGWCGKDADETRPPIDNISETKY